MSTDSKMAPPFPRMSTELLMRLPVIYAAFAIGAALGGGTWSALMADSRTISPGAYFFFGALITLAVLSVASLVLVVIWAYVVDVREKKEADYKPPYVLEIVLYDEAGSGFGEINGPNEDNVYRKSFLEPPGGRAPVVGESVWAGGNDYTVKVPPFLRLRDRGSYEVHLEIPASDQTDTWHKDVQAEGFVLSHA